MTAELAVEDVLQSMDAFDGAQMIGALALAPFVALLVMHGINRDVPLFLASFAAFGVAFLGIVRIPTCAALRCAKPTRYTRRTTFCSPLFLSITLLTSAGFFEGLKTLVQQGIATLGHGHMAFGQFRAAPSSRQSSTTTSSPTLRRGRWRTSMSGSCISSRWRRSRAMRSVDAWTHIGCAQSVVAFAFIQRDVDKHFTPVEWIKEMTPVIIRILVLVTILLYAESALLTWLD